MVLKRTVRTDRRYTMKIEWEDGFRISARAGGDAIVISANRAGLLSLAGQLRTLAEESPGSHLHYDEHNSLEDGSKELIIELLRDPEEGKKEC